MRGSAGLCPTRAGAHMCKRRFLNRAWPGMSVLKAQPEGRASRLFMSGSASPFMLHGLYFFLGAELQIWLACFAQVLRPFVSRMRFVGTRPCRDKCCHFRARNLCYVRMLCQLEPSHGHCWACQAHDNDEASHPSLLSRDAQPGADTKLGQVAVIQCLCSNRHETCNSSARHTSSAWHMKFIH